MLAADSLLVVFTLGLRETEKLLFGTSLLFLAEGKGIWWSRCWFLKLLPRSDTSHCCSHLLAKIGHMGKSDINGAGDKMLPSLPGRGSQYLEQLYNFLYRLTLRQGEI